MRTEQITFKAMPKVGTILRINYVDFIFHDHTSPNQYDIEQNSSPNTTACNTWSTLCKVDDELASQFTYKYENNTITLTSGKNTPDGVMICSCDDLNVECTLIGLTDEK